MIILDALVTEKQKNEESNSSKDKKHTFREAINSKI